MEVRAGGPCVGEEMEALWVMVAAERRSRERRGRRGEEREGRRVHVQASGLSGEARDTEGHAGLRQKLSGSSS